MLGYHQIELPVFSLRSFTAYPDPALKKAASPIGIILLADNFYVKKVVVPSKATPTDKKGGCTVPWHLYGIKGGYLEGITTGVIMNHSC